MTQKDNQKFADDFAFDYSNNFDELKKHLDDYAVVLTFDTREDFEEFRDECNRLKELEQSQKQLAYVELLLIALRFTMFDNEDGETLVCPIESNSFSNYLLSRLEYLGGTDNE